MSVCDHEIHPCSEHSSRQIGLEPSEDPRKDGKYPRGLTPPSVHRAWLRFRQRLRPKYQQHLVNRVDICINVPRLQLGVTMVQSEQQQRSQRLQVRMPCKLSFGGRATEGFSNNLSTSGVFVCVAPEAFGAETPTAGDRGLVRFRLPDQTKEIEVGTEVVWVLPDDTKACAKPALGLGMRITSCSKEATGHLAEFVRDFRHTVMVLTSGCDEVIPMQKALANNYRVVPCRTAEEALERLATETVAVLVTDQNMLDTEERGPFHHLLRRLPHAQIIELFTGDRPNANDQREFIALGRLVHHVGVPIDVIELQKVIRRAVDIHSIEMEKELLRIELDRLNQKLRRENAYLRHRVPGSHGFEGILGHSVSLQRTLEQLERVRLTDVRVHIAGETGTGKELVARALHANSPRAQGPFVAQNCAGLTETLLQSTLFGHRKGSFTGAEHDRPGVFTQANGGTLFLDEVAELSPATQAILLRVLESGEITPVGASEPVRVDVRIISATHQDLWERVRAGQFRDDLHFRLMVVMVELPPLRERIGDIPLLAQHFLELHCLHYDKHVGGFAPETMEILESYNWPGNIRELENEIERLVVLADAGDKIRPELLSEHVLTSVGIKTEIGGDRVLPAPLQESTEFARRLLDSGRGLDDVIDSLQTSILVEALKQSGGNQSRAAQQLGIPRQTLSSRMRRYGLDIADSRWATRPPKEPPPGEMS